MAVNIMKHLYCEVNDITKPKTNRFYLEGTVAFDDLKIIVLSNHGSIVVPMKKCSIMKKEIQLIGSLHEALKPCGL